MLYRDYLLVNGYVIYIQRFLYYCGVRNHDYKDIQLI